MAVVRWLWCRCGVRRSSSGSCNLDEERLWLSLSAEATVEILDVFLGAGDETTDLLDLERQRRIETE